MRYEVKLNPENLEMHLCIESDAHRIKNGLFNFVIKVNRGVITDYVVYEDLATTSVTELTITPFN